MARPPTHLNNPFVFIHKFFIPGHVGLHHCVKSRSELIKVKLLHLGIKHRVLWRCYLLLIRRGSSVFALVLGWG